MRWFLKGNFFTHACFVFTYFFRIHDNSKPETGVMLRYAFGLMSDNIWLLSQKRDKRLTNFSLFILFYRDGSEVLQDARSGNILAEILIKSQDNNVMPVVATFASPWRLGAWFDMNINFYTIAWGFHPNPQIIFAGNPSNFFSSAIPFSSVPVRLSWNYFSNWISIWRWVPGFKNWWWCLLSSNSETRKWKE